MMAPMRILAAGTTSGARAAGDAPAQAVVSALAGLIADAGLACDIATGIRPLSGQDLLAALADAKLGVVLDAVPCEAHSCLRRFADLDDFEDIHALTAQGIALGEVLELGDALGDRPRTLWVYGIGFDPGKGETLPEADVMRHAREILADVRSFLGHS
ncbi:MAG: hypothetical protein ACPGU7_01260 [Gammaproteobacteria bacterium]